MTELIWEGKYIDGKKATPLRIALPFQTVETVNESVQHNERTIDEYIKNKDKWYNRLIWGDKKYVLPSLLPEFAGKIDLIYIDPPFDTGANFSFNAIIPDNPETEEDETSEFVKQPSIIEQKAYRDTWGDKKDSIGKYCHWFYETVVILRELLSDTGSIYVHLDWHVGHYAKLILDEVFGYDNFRNEIIWHYYNKYSTAKTCFPRAHDIILFYSKTSSLIFNEVREEREKPVKQLKRINENGILKNAKDENGNLLYQISEDKKIDDVWKIPQLQPASSEWTGYRTQKHHYLLERIILTSSNTDSLVLDCFVGSGTTAAVAEKLNRRWIACDLGRFAIHTTRKRLLGIPNVKPFVVQNLGKYERQQWMQSEFADATDKIAIQKRYQNFIVELYQGETLEGYEWIHGVKAGRMLHVGSVDAPVTVEDIKDTIKEFWKLSAEDKKNNKGIDFLGWEFAFDVNETAKEYALHNNVDVRFRKIPREVLEPKAVEQGDIKFYDLAYLEMKAKKGKSRELTITIEDFIINLDDIPKEVQSKITHWSQWIDYWAIDWDYCEDTFHNQWQSYRTKKHPNLELSAQNVYEESGTYTIVVKVIDILGNDTTKSITVEI